MPQDLLQTFATPGDLLDEDKISTSEAWVVKRCRNILCDGDRSAARKLSRARKVQLLLRAVALLQLQQLCKTWEDAEHVNHSVYDIRRLSSLQHEEIKQAFAPLHSGLCATCGRL